MSTTTQFRTIKSAKDYLVGRITAEAERQGVPLSRVEREMLYFTEEGGISKHMENVNEEFERECNEDEYEAKIGSCVRSLESRSTQEEQEMWDDAVLKLCEGDHYLQVLIDAGVPPKTSLHFVPKGLRRWLPDLNSTRQRLPGDRRRLVLVAIIIVFVAIACALLFDRR